MKYIYISVWFTERDIEDFEDMEEWMEDYHELFLLYNFINIEW